MGSCCCGDKDPNNGLDESLVAGQRSPEYVEMSSITLDAKMKRVIKKANRILRFALPEAKRLFPGATEQETFEELVDVMDKVIQQEHPQLSFAERHEVLNRTVPDGYPLFQKIVQRRVQEQKTNDRARSNTLGPPNGRSRNALPRMILLWFESDKDGNGSLSTKEIQYLLQRINIDMSERAVEKLVQDFDTSHNGQLEFEEFVRMYEKLTTVDVIDKAFAARSRTVSVPSSPPAPAPSDNSKQKSHPYMTEEELRAFLGDVQKETPAEIDKDVRGFGKMEEINGAKCISFRQFQLGLLDHKLNGWMHPREFNVHQDMSQPLTHYFMDSSHNTYLDGHQLTGNSSCDMYRKAFLSGCRCVEIDVWDGANGDPVVTHGHTIVSKVRFYDVCKAINETAFRNSPYPIVLSFELHTCAEQQRTMVRMMKEVFGEKLASAADANATTLTSPNFTPNALRNKVLVKNKRLKMNGKEPNNQEEEREEVDAPEQPPPAPGATHAAPHEHSLTQELSDTAYLASCKIKTLEDSFSLPHYAIASVDELKIEKWSVKNTQQVTDLTKQMFVREYPKGLRMDSSNLCPQAGWNCGVQCIAMNIQTCDDGMRLNVGRFRINGQCGYQLKPRVMRSPGPAQFNDERVLIVRVVCGVQLPKPGNSKHGEIIDPYVQLWINGVPSDDTSSHIVETKVIDDNGFNPTWNETFTFHVSAVELATLTLRVLEKDPLSSDFIGDNSLPLQSLREGLRCVPLYISTDVPIPSPCCLLCEFSWSNSSGFVDVQSIEVDAGSHTPQTRDVQSSSRTFPIPTEQTEEPVREQPVAAVDTAQPVREQPVAADTAQPPQCEQQPPPQQQQAAPPPSEPAAAPQEPVASHGGSAEPSPLDADGLDKFTRERMDRL